MGVIQHNAVVAVTSNSSEFERVKNFVNNLKEKRHLFLFEETGLNNYSVVVMIPDGSKEGWPESERGDITRDKFIEELEKVEYEDGSSPWEYVEISFGKFGQKIVRGNCEENLIGQ